MLIVSGRGAHECRIACESKKNIPNHVNFIPTLDSLPACMESSAATCGPEIPRAFFSADINNSMSNATVHQQTTIAPMLSVRRGKQAVEFYKKAFGADEVFRIESETGEVVARLSVGGAEFWVADESPAHQNFSPESLGGSTARMVLLVDDPDRIFERAIAAGGRAVTPMADQHGFHIGRVVDPFGHHWEIARPL
jgi:PhnB protein